MDKNYQEAFTEVDEILKLMPIDLSSKVPPKLRNIISKNKDLEYKTTIKEPLEERDLKKETIVILGLIYRDFIATPEEKEQLKLKDSEYLRKIEEDMQKQYDINKVFEKRKAKIEEETSEQQTQLVVYEEPGFIKKFFNLIKGIFKKNK